LNGPGVTGIVGSRSTAMTCPFCNAPNPDTDYFCGNCAAPLDAENQKLRQRIVTIIGQEFKDREMIAALVGKEVSDRAEDRFWQWAKILGLAMTIFVAGLGFFGFTSFSDIKNARARINEASQSAVVEVNAVAKKSEDLIATTGLNTISSMKNEVGVVSKEAKAERLEIENYKKEIASKKADVQEKTDDLYDAAAGLEAAKAKLEAFKQALKQTPDKPIDQLNKRLFIDTPGSSPNKIAPYGLSDTRTGVKTIQTRLAELGCYKGQPSGTFDQQTANAVIAFVNVNASLRPSPSDYSSSNGEMPSPTIGHAVPGQVDYHRWRQLFAQAAAKCPE
jgi:hypothetical protein